MFRLILLYTLLLPLISFGQNTYDENTLKQMQFFYEQDSCGKMDHQLVSLVLAPAHKLTYDEHKSFVEEGQSKKIDLEFIVYFQVKDDGLIDSVWVETVAPTEGTWSDGLQNNLSRFVKDKGLYWPSCRLPVHGYERNWTIVLPFSVRVVDGKRSKMLGSEALKKRVMNYAENHLCILAPINRSNHYFSHH